MAPKVVKRMAKKPSCRIYGIMAREASTAVLFRRGPSKYVQLIRWDTSKDLFESGQWFHGRVYERRCDVSPDGQLLVYFAANWKCRSGADSGTWTAISKPPYFTALAIWFKGDAWCGGGLFRSNRELGLNNGGPGKFRAGHDVSNVPLSVFNLDLGRGEDDPIEGTREARDGWKVVRKMKVTAPPLPSSLPPRPPEDQDSSAMKEWLAKLSKWMEDNPVDHTGYITHVPGLLEKTCGSVRLQRTERMQGYHLVREYAISGSTVDLTGVDWAEWDHRQRLVFTKGGDLFAVLFRGRKDPRITRLADLGANTFISTEAPAWARRW